MTEFKFEIIYDNKTEAATITNGGSLSEAYKILYKYCVPNTAAYIKMVSKKVF